MDNIQFALPTIPAADMSWEEQARVALNQATAVTVSAWLSYATAVLQLGHHDTVADDEAHTFIRNDRLGARERTWALTPTELISLINEVQIALAP